MNIEKTYLGDGAYAESFYDGSVMLYTSNGEQITNKVFLEPDVLQSFLKFVKRIQS